MFRKANVSFEEEMNRIQIKQSLVFRSKVHKHTKCLGKCLKIIKTHVITWPRRFFLAWWSHFESHDWPKSNETIQWLESLIWSFFVVVVVDWFVQIILVCCLVTPLDGDKRVFFWVSESLTQTIRYKVLKE